jgi:hypothetical protein
VPAQAITALPRAAASDATRELSPHEIMKAIEADPIIRRANELFGARLDHGEEER